MLTDGESDDDWAQEEIPEVLAMIGLAALPPLEAALADTAMDIYARNALLKAFPLIAQDHPETRRAHHRDTHPRVGTAGERCGILRVHSGLAAGHGSR